MLAQMWMHWTQRARGPWREWARRHGLPGAPAGAPDSPIAGVAVDRGDASAARAASAARVTRATSAPGDHGSACRASAARRTQCAMPSVRSAGARTSGITHPVSPRIARHASAAVGERSWLTDVGRRQHAKPSAHGQGRSSNDSGVLQPNEGPPHSNPSNVSATAVDKAASNPQPRRYGVSL